jgi:hypothetical protein
VGEQSLFQVHQEEGLSMRKKPSHDAPVLPRRLICNEIVRIAAKGGGSFAAAAAKEWVQVTLPDGGHGWVFTNAASAATGGPGGTKAGIVVTIVITTVVIHHHRH